MVVYSREITADSVIEDEGIITINFPAAVVRLTIAAAEDLAGMLTMRAAEGRRARCRLPRPHSL